METLTDKIASIQGKIETNEAFIEKLKAETDEKIKALKEENKKLGKVVKKLQDTEATIAGIFSSDAE
jgi:chromosome segregation ATPase